MKIDISVVVITYNRAEMLQNALVTLVSQVTEDKFSYEIVVIDDGSSDSTAEVVKGFSPKSASPSLRYIYKEHSGVGDARNYGVEAARGKWLAFCDDDQLAEPRWLAELYLVALERGADCVDGPVHLKLPDPAGLELGPRSRGILGEKFLIDPPAQYSSKNTIGTGNVLILRSLFGIVGGFDTSLHQGEDTDFLWRVERAGFKIFHAPQALVHHVIPQHRLHLPYLRGTCLRKGVATARIFLKYGGALKLALSFCWRLGVALGRDLPEILFARLFHNSPLLLDGRCGLWFSIGFVRASLFLGFPRLFPQEEFIKFYYYGLDEKCFLERDSYRNHHHA